MARLSVTLLARRYGSDPRDVDLYPMIEIDGMLVAGCLEAYNRQHRDTNVQIIEWFSESPRLVILCVPGAPGQSQLSLFRLTPNDVPASDFGAGRVQAGPVVSGSRATPFYIGGTGPDAPGFGFVAGATSTRAAEVFGPGWGEVAGELVILGPVDPGSVPFTNFLRGGQRLHHDEDVTVTPLAVEVEP